MDLVSILALAAASSTDCLIIGLNYGVKGIRISRVSNGFIALVCFFGTCLSMLLGRLAASFLHPAWGEAVGGLLFLALGLYMLKGTLIPDKKTTARHYSKDPETVDRDDSKVIELRESLLIGLLLCLNNVGIGIGGGIAGLPVLLAPALCALLSLLLIGLGYGIGRKAAEGRLAFWLELCSACLILFLGLQELLSLARSVLPFLSA